jgi:tripartite-type tricarboxylate transporter receptor subunit TctC
MIRRRFGHVLFSLALSAAAPLASAQDAFPSGPIRFIVPYPAGGPAGLVARAIGDKLSGALGQPVIIDNRPGAGGNLGTDMVAKAAPDGLTLLLGTNGPLVINVSLYSKLSFDPTKDFEPITQVASIPIVLVVHPSVEANTVQDLIALAKDKPGQLSYGTSGNGSGGHLAGALLSAMAGISMTHIPYNGAAPATTDVLGGHTHISFPGLLPVLPHIKSGKLRALGVATPKRASFARDIPTIAESGLPGYEITSWYGVLAPAATPKPIIARLHREIVRILELPDVRDQLFVKGGLEFIGNSPEEFAAVLRREVPEYARIVKLAGAKAE